MCGGTAIAPADLKPTLYIVLELMETPEVAHVPQVARFFGLTETDARLAGFLMAGGSLAAYARENDVSRNTARNQLQANFQKTHVNRQAELVALLKDTAESFATE